MIDRKGALQALQCCKALLGTVQAPLRDSDYVGKRFVQVIQDILGEHVAVQIATRSQLPTSEVTPPRRVFDA